MIFNLLGGKIFRNVAESFVDNVIRDKVSSPVIGSIVYCDLAAGYAEHSGVYIGNNSIVHLSGSGEIEIVSPGKFLKRLGGLNMAVSIYVSCRNKNPVGSEDVANRAKSRVGRNRDYNVVMDNCHQFSSGCITDNFGNASNFMWMLKDDAKKHLGANEWRVWDR